MPGLFTWCKGKMYWIPGNSRNILEFFRRPEVTGHYKKIPPLYLKKHLLATAGNFKVNEQTKYKSASSDFLVIPSCREKARNTDGIIDFLSLRYKSEITPPCVIFILQNSYSFDFSNFSNGRVYCRSNTLVKFIIIYYHVSCRINGLLIFLSNLQAGETWMLL